MSTDASSTGPRPLADGIEIRPARSDEVQDLVPLMRGYTDFYEADPSDDGLRTMASTLIADPEQGALFIARDGDGGAVGFAAMDWKWSSLRGARIGYLEDLFVSPDGRGGGIAEALIEACAELCRQRSVPVLEWMTAPDNKRAQSVYERVGAEGSTWVEFELEL
jgi:GNAT superfamily N-acetyltransferase